MITRRETIQKFNIPFGISSFIICREHVSHLAAAFSGYATRPTMVHTVSTEDPVLIGAY
jgi:hypothetical protein